MMPTQTEIDEAFKEEHEAFLAFQEARTKTTEWTLKETAARNRLQLARDAKADIIHRTLTN